MENSRKRAAARGWVTRQVSSLTKTYSEPNISVVKLSEAMKTFQQRLAALDEVQAEVEVELELKDLEADLDEAHRFREEALVEWVKANERMDQLQMGGGSSSSDTQRSKASVKLPKIELPIFRGKIINWQSFWEQFTALIGNTDMPEINKFNYLLSLLEGEAKVCVQGLSLTAANYKTACELLKERFGRPERIIFHHVQALLNGTIPVKTKGYKYVSRLWGMRDEFLIHIRSLEVLGVSGKQCETFLTPIIISRLPSEIRLEWARKGAGKESNLEWLLKFLQEEIESIERSETFKDVTPGNDDSPYEQRKVVSSNQRAKDRLASTSALHVSTSEACVICNKRHKSEDCYELLNLQGQERADRIKRAGVCFICMKRGHRAKGCLAKCSKCSGRHNVLLCGVKLNKGDDSKIDLIKVKPVNVDERNVYDSSDLALDRTSVSMYNTVSPSKSCSILQTARILLVGEDGETHMARLMFDSGSDRTYVSSKLVRKYKPKWVSSEPISYSSFGGYKSCKTKFSNIYELKVLDNENNTCFFRATEVPVISEPLIRPCVPVNILDKFAHVKLADEYDSNSPMHIDILVGLDVYWKMLTPQDSIHIGDIVAIKSIFGYVLSGSWHTSSPSKFTSTQMLCITRVSEFDLEKFWDLESVGICNNNQDAPNVVMEQFNQNIKYCNGRYEVALPWKSKEMKSELVNNVYQAEKRLHKLHVRLDENDCLRNEYYDVFQEYERTGIIEEIPKPELDVMHPVFYLPHRPVIKDSNVSSKVRPVFDASAKGYNGISLNECLLTGPSLNPDLVEVLIRFRRWPIAITGDITKAFLQIGVKREDRDVHRFLLKAENGSSTKVRHMRFLRVPFGNTSSPFLLNATIKYHLSKYQSSEVIIDLMQDMYVDNLLSGADNIDEASGKFCEAHAVLSQAGMPLTKWVSNNETITSKLNADFDVEYAHKSSSVLGIHWCNVRDTFSFQGLEMNTQFEFSYTKRAVLSIIARIFDPLGLISPYVMYGKIMLQEIWRLGLSWDDLLPDEIEFKFKRWIHSSEYLKIWKVNRSFFHDVAWKDLSHLELHAFGDASEKAYGACVYIRTVLKDGSCLTSLVVSKSRVAPIKAITLPRLELLGALLCARLIKFVKSALKLAPDIPLFCWSDSKIVLSWIQGDPHKWKMFVSNRVTEIQTLTAPSCWHHCSGKDNPADLISRGILADQFINNSFWLNGPHWLSEPFPCCQEERKYSTVEEECEYNTVVCTTGSSVPVFEFSRWSDFNKALRIAALVLRFISNCKPRNVKHSGPLSTEEINVARKKGIYCEQRQVYSTEIDNLMHSKGLPKNSSLKNLDPFLDDQGLLRVKGRLENAELDYESKHPIIIPKGYFALLLARFQHLFLKHAGIATVLSALREKFWVIGCRRIIKSVIKGCIRCQRQDSRPCNQVPPPLPESRVKAAPPFSVTGIDYAGPLFCADFPSKKFYILLFTCAVVRAVHLELTDSMSLVDCMLALRRFSARRGLPSVIYSDNFKTFVAAVQEVQKVYGHLAPHWKFIVPRSPWWGGWWERLVRSVKSALKKSLGGNCVSRCELETIVHEVEACINSRPLTYVEDKPEDFNPLSPSQFLIGKSTPFHGAVEPSPFPVTSTILRNKKKVKQLLLDKFWRLWNNDYIRNLPPVVRNFKSNCNLKLGDVVLLKEDHTPRLQWPLGVIVDVFPDRRGLIRSVKVKTSSGIVKRSVQKLYRLEMCDTKGDKFDIDNVELKV